MYRGWDGHPGKVKLRAKIRLPETSHSKVQVRGVNGPVRPLIWFIPCSISQTEPSRASMLSTCLLFNRKDKIFAFARCCSCLVHMGANNKLLRLTCPRSVLYTTLGSFSISLSLCLATTVKLTTRVRGDSLILVGNITQMFLDPLQCNLA